jgi:hypothetical protein
MVTLCSCILGFNIYILDRDVPRVLYVIVSKLIVCSQELKDSSKFESRSTDTDNETASTSVHRNIPGYLLDSLSVQPSARFTNFQLVSL